jgi:hypothetical protein
VKLVLGLEGDGLPPEVFVELLELLVRRSDPARMGKATEG